jgi:uncharacterized protein YcfJ
MKTIALSVLTLAVTLAAGSAFADDKHGRYDRDDDDGRYEQSTQRSDVATVVRVERIGGNDYSYERQECWNEQTRDYDDGYYRDTSGRLYRGDGRKGNTSGAVLGAIVGGALGNQAGKGDGRRAATIAGAVIGGVIGNNAGRNNNEYQYRDNTSGTTRRCRTVYDNQNASYRDDATYNVTYRYAGQTYHTVTDYPPGRTMRILVSVTPQRDNNSYGYR